MIALDIHSDTVRTYQDLIKTLIGRIQALKIHVEFKILPDFLRTREDLFSFGHILSDCLTSSRLSQELSRLIRDQTLLKLTQGLFRDCEDYFGYIQIM